MIDPETRKAIYLLHKKGMGVRKISRSLGVARETVRKIIRAQGEMPASIRTDRIEIDADRLRYSTCGMHQQHHVVLGHRNDRGLKPWRSRIRPSRRRAQEQTQR